MTRTTCSPSAISIRTSGALWEFTHTTPPPGRKAVAVGECGLDFYYDHSPREVQLRVMREQWELAIELDLPVVVHNRDSNEQMLEVAREYPDLKADFHSLPEGSTWPAS
jgi:Tat protein secretion system quality control protein TatD with DNase activity